jgi:crossover junction endodeoxyribonuclease RuvC
MKILALDLARNTGFALGNVRDRAPMFGSIRFGSSGASHAALFAAGLTWASENFRIWRPDRIIYEAPLQFRHGKSSPGNDEISHGLPAIMMGVAFLLGIFDVRKATAKDIRLHFIGENPPRQIAKRKTIGRCAMCGWKVTDDNQADACALWSYACGLENMEAALRPTELFGQGA